MRQNLLKSVVPKIEHEFPDLRALTKHDSFQPFKTKIYFGEGGTNSFEIGKIMLDTIEEVTGFRPSGKAKRYPKIKETSVCSLNGSQRVTTIPET